MVPALTASILFAVAWAIGHVFGYFHGKDVGLRYVSNLDTAPPLKPRKPLVIVSVRDGSMSAQAYENMKNKLAEDSEREYVYIKVSANSNMPNDPFIRQLE